MSYKEIAYPLAERGVPVIPLRPRTKIAFLSEWETLASTNPDQIDAWDKEYPEANCGSVAQAKPDGFWFFEVDRPEVLQRIESETGKKIPATFRVRSSPGRGHYYFEQSPASLVMGNIAQGFVKENDWSARVDRQYVVSPGSLHPKSGLPYEVVSTAEIIQAPDWLISWCISQKVKKIDTPVNTDGPIISGGRNNILTSIGGKMRHAGSNHSEIETTLLRINYERCHPPLDESEVKTIAASVSRYAVGKTDTVLFSGRPGGIGPAPVQTSAPVEIERPVITGFRYPKFPSWVMSGTSVYNGLVKPYCDVNSRYPEFMFMPAVALMLNYLGTKVSIKNKNIIPSIFLAVIGRKGRVIKSSSVEDAITYFQCAGVMDHANPSLKNADGKALVWSAGSPEGLGIDMQRLNCKNAILFYDELKTLTSKASIETSTLTSNLLTMYESGKFQNQIKSRKETYAHNPGTYCATLIVCSTDKSFLADWSKLSGKSSGLDDRFFFLLQPEVLTPLIPQVAVPTQEGAVITRQRIDAAIKQAEYKITDSSPLADRIGEIGNRAEIRAEKFALYFAVDLGLNEIDEDCLERALALADYEISVKKWLETFEGTTREGSIQQELLHLLRRHGGIITTRDMERAMHPSRHGTSLWGQVYGGLLKTGQICEEGSGRKGDPKKIILLKAPEEDDD